ncbi:shikimate dehydrogenase [Romboutsia sp. 1001713B170131_170501_G6]|uniref:shikimate dehydrogenase n=1 Tax=Romboutsia sp. 1001713B170131_170501_G6 TaxID=2787108 RepID=UPI001A9C1692|nr:shikimate dehydrogenase [Romboutsia sp. 1001713B170131_170501_G6]
MINSTTKLVGLLGHPIKQSFSPSIHNYLFKKYNQNNIYCCFDVKESDLEEAVKSIKTLNMVGCNVTIPHKVDVMKFLEDIDKNARLIGAVNTIKNDGGFLIGYNTDGLGFVKSIIDKGYDLNNKKIMIIGAGGSSRSIAVQLASNNVKSIEIRNRSIQKAMEISEIIRENFKITSTYSNNPIDKNDIEDIDILINTTPVGMESNECPIDESIRVKGDLLVCDIVYKPQNTSFIKWAKLNNLDVVYGIDMLINQGLEAFYIWTGVKPSKEDELYLKELYYNQVD